MQETYLAHHGVKGMKWGIRRYQNPDGSLTAEGERQYGNVKKMRRSAEYKAYKKEQYNKYRNIADKIDKSLDDRLRANYEKQKGIHNITKNSLKAAKQGYKDKKIDKDHYKQLKRTLLADERKYYNIINSRSKLDIYNTQKIIQKHETDYLADVMGTNSKEYQLAKEYLDSNVVVYGDWRIYKTQ